MKMISFYSEVGPLQTLQDDPEAFEEAWSQFLIKGEEPSTKWPKGLFANDAVIK